ncbi:MAG TPA: hypothetical protein VJV78_44635 [Polyangiales bacterium]|nr:hypothetical protein [Polyangiales bacterium]
MFNPKLLGLLLLVSCAADVRSDAPDVESLSIRRSICGFSHPESVAAARGRYFVSNIGAELDPTAADADGFISELDRHGEILALRAFAPLDAPKGLAVVERTLYVADLARVVGFDIDSHERVFEASVTGDTPVLLNDLAVVDTHTLWVSDTLGNALWRLDLPSAGLTPIAHDVLGANGIAIDHARGRAYVVGVGADFGGGGLYELALDGNGGAREIDGPFGVLDGLALLHDGRLIASDWVELEQPAAGELITFTRAGKRQRTVRLAEELHGPADFYYDARAELLWVPAMADNCVRVVPVP